MSIEALMVFSDQCFDIQELVSFHYMDFSSVHLSFDNFNSLWFCLVGEWVCILLCFSILCLQNIERFILFFVSSFLEKLVVFSYVFYFMFRLLCHKFLYNKTFFSFYNIYNLILAFHFTHFGGMLVVVCFNKDPNSLRN